MPKFSNNSTKSGIMNNIYLNFKFILSNAMDYLKKLSGVFGLNWSTSFAYCLSLREDLKDIIPVNNSVTN